MTSDIRSYYAVVRSCFHFQLKDNSYSAVTN
jgi:hypothetical protein